MGRLLKTLLVLAIVSGATWYGCILPAYRAHQPHHIAQVANPAPLLSPEPFPATITLIYLFRYEVTIRPIPGQPTLQSVTVRYDPKATHYWHRLARWAVIDSFVMSRRSIALRSYRDPNHYAAILRLAYPTTSFKIGVKPAFGKWVTGQVDLNLSRPAYVHHLPLVKVVYDPQCNILPLPPSHSADRRLIFQAEATDFNGLEVREPGVADLWESDEYLNHKVAKGLFLLPLLLDPALEEVEGAGEAVVGEAAAFGEAAAAGEVLGESEETFAAAGRLTNGLRISGTSWWGVPEESYQIEAGAIRTVGPFGFGTGRIVAETGPAGQVLNNTGFVIDGRTVEWISSDGSMFSDASLDGFVGKFQPNHTITNFFGEKIGSASH